VAASALVALATQAAGLRNSLEIAAQHQHQRDGAAWFAEWMVLPQIALGTASALQIAVKLAATLKPDVDRMRATACEGLGLMQAEALSFALAGLMPRPDAQAAIKSLCARAVAEGTPLATLVRAAYPDLPPDRFDIAGQLGDAPATARAFAARVRAL
jgi:3-carboxy-cis,cis-muconate cycloisomerase